MRRIALFVLAAALAGMLLPAGAANQPGEFVMAQVAIRQGDAAVFQGPCGELGLLDTNRFREDEVLAVLEGFGSRSLEWVAVTHYDADHLGGIVDVATAPGASVGTVYDRGGDRNAKDSQTYRDYFDWATSGTTTRVAVDIGASFTLCSGSDEVVFDVVSAGTDGTAAGGVPVTEENDKGVCLRITYGSFDAATCGDVNGTDEGSRTDVESAVAPAIGEVEFAKINHHGSIFSSNLSYVSTLSAQAAVVSTGANGFGHPDPTVLARWDDVGDVYRTQDLNNDPVDGNVTVSTTGESTFTVDTSEGTSRTYPLDGVQGTPSPTASPTPSPSPSLTTHQRMVSLSLRRHLIAKGVVAVPDGFAECATSVTVRIQRRKAGQWVRAGVDVSDTEGAYRVDLADRAGKYRAKVKAETLSDTEGCSHTTSATQRHAHTAKE